MVQDTDVGLNSDDTDLDLPDSEDESTNDRGSRSEDGPTSDEDSRSSVSMGASSTANDDEPTAGVEQGNDGSQMAPQVAPQVAPQKAPQNKRHEEREAAGTLKRKRPCETMVASSAKKLRSNLDVTRPRMEQALSEAEGRLKESEGRLRESEDRWKETAQMARFAASHKGMVDSIDLLLEAAKCFLERDHSYNQWIFPSSEDPVLMQAINTTMVRLTKHRGLDSAAAVSETVKSVNENPLASNKGMKRTKVSQMSREVLRT